MPAHSSKEYQRKYMQEYRKRNKPYWVKVEKQFFQIEPQSPLKTMLVITGECKICNQFPCKHTGYAVTKQFQDKFEEVKTE